MPKASKSYLNKKGFFYICLIEKSAKDAEEK